MRHDGKRSHLGIVIRLSISTIRMTSASAPMFIPLRLEVGDALQRPADLAWIGTGAVLRHRVEALAGQRFAPLDMRDFGRPQRSDGNFLQGVDLLCAPDFTWKQVVSVRSRPTHHVRGSYVDAIHTLHTLMHRKMQPQRLLLVPWRHTPIDLVAKSMLFNLWYMHRHAYNFGARKFPADVTIVDLDDVGIFRDLIGPRLDELQDFFDMQRQRWPWSQRERCERVVRFELV